MTPRARCVLLLALALGASACTKHDGLILLDLRGSGPLVAPVVHVRLSAKGWPTRSVSTVSGIGPAGFRFGYYGPADGSAVTVTAEAMDGDDCVLGKGSATVAALAAGATSDPIKLFVRPVAGNGCTVVDAGSDAGGEDAGGEDAGADSGADAETDATDDASGDATQDAEADAEVDAGTDAGDDAGSDAGTD